ncbi:MAG TPA: hypothetical protein VNM22_19015 [Candidatus Limnocylindrales bacterium]|nr:hypothetical protein [Candidatus Limnocylindrales bacterium]
MADESKDSNVYISRLRVRYTRDKFPEDLVFQETPNQQTFQGRYIFCHPFTGEMKCAKGLSYQKSLSERYGQQAQILAHLTGEDIQEIRKKMEIADPIDKKSTPGGKKIFE